MKIEKIIYDTTREIFNLEDKLRIATIFLFCKKVSSSKLAELIYTDNHEKFISEITKEYESYDVDFHINFSNSNVKNAFKLTLEKVKIEYDSNGYLKALFQKDEYALVIEEILNYNFNKVEFKKFTKNLSEQLSFNF